LATVNRPGKDAEKDGAEKEDAGKESKEKGAKKMGHCARVSLGKGDEM